MCYSEKKIPTYLQGRYLILERHFGESFIKTDDIYQAFVNYKIDCITNDIPDYIRIEEWFTPLEFARIAFWFNVNRHKMSPQFREWVARIIGKPLTKEERAYKEPIKKQKFEFNEICIFYILAGIPLFIALSVLGWNILK